LEEETAMTRAEQDVVAQAGKLLTAIRQSDGGGAAATADDLLLFLYRLHDQYRIVRSTSDRFRGSSFSFLHDLQYQLESRPDETMRSSEWRTFVDCLLSDIVSGRITIATR
jgi:hypothetical protein